jgi:hypothetical protein
MNQKAGVKDTMGMTPCYEKGGTDALIQPYFYNCVMSAHQLF